MIALSELDKRRFGHVVAKTDIVAGQNLRALLAECEAGDVELLIARCPTGLVPEMQQMERLGFFLTDTLVVWCKQLDDSTPPPVPLGFHLRAALTQDAPEVGRVAAAAFKNYGGHYHADARLDPADCDAVYASWATNLCTDANGDSEMLLITNRENGSIAGFAALRRHNDSEFDGTLFAVDPYYQGRGLFTALVKHSEHWGATRSLSRMLYSTQLTNLAPQGTLCRRGFAPLRSFYTLHKWFD